MPLRNIVTIDEEKCTGCGQCLTACAEGALEIVNGKAKLVSDTHCDGLGACLGVCPEGAITVDERESEPFDEEAVHKHLAERESVEPAPAFSCPGARAQKFQPGGAADGEGGSELAQWPVQLRLVPTDAPYFQDADLIVTADCVPFAMADYHARLLEGKAVAMSCPKLDDAEEAAGKLAQIIQQSSLRRLVVAHMEVPCCFGLQHIAKQALAASGKDIPLEEITVTVNGRTR